MADACDAHIHIFNSRFTERVAADDMSSTPATVADYRAVQQRIGTGRVVIVTPRNYDTDNSVTVDAIRLIGLGRARGVAVVRPTVSEAELEALHEGGIRGIRFTLYTPDKAPTNFDMVEPLSHRVHELGWHVQLHWTAEQIVAHEPMLRRLPTAIVFDHLARLPLPAALAHPACAVISRLLENGRTWIKLSAPYLDSVVGERGRFADVDHIARHWVRVAPQRVVWGSDWPHTSETRKPDDSSLILKLDSWADDVSTRSRILVSNPAQLYGFEPCQKCNGKCPRFEWHHGEQRHCLLQHLLNPRVTDDVLHR